VKSIIVYTRDLKPQNLYPRRIISPPAPNKCCAGHMEMLGRPRVDEQGRRFCYKRCRVCGFALRYFLEPVGTILTPAAPELRSRKSAPSKDRAAVAPAYRLSPTAQRTARKPAVSLHVPKPSREPAYSADARRKSTARRRR